jgi:hypothetical protein
METRLGQNSHCREPSTRDLPHYESYLSWNSSMSVIIFDYSILQRPMLIFFFSGRDDDYQTLNLTFASNVLKFGFIISLFPKPLKP